MTTRRQARSAETAARGRLRPVSLRPTNNAVASMALPIRVEALSCHAPVTLCDEPLVSDLLLVRHLALGAARRAWRRRAVAADKSVAVVGQATSQHRPPGEHLVDAAHRHVGGSGTPPLRAQRDLQLRVRRVGLHRRQRLAWAAGAAPHHDGGGRLVGRLRRLLARAFRGARRRQARAGVGTTATTQRLQPQRGDGDTAAARVRRRVKDAADSTSATHGHAKAAQFRERSSDAPRRRELASASRGGSARGAKQRSAHWKRQPTDATAKLRGVAERRAGCMRLLAVREVGSAGKRAGQRHNATRGRGRSSQLRGGRACLELLAALIHPSPIAVSRRSRRLLAAV